MRVVMFNATFNIMSVISWWSFFIFFFLVEETGDILTTDLWQVTDKLSHNVVSSTPLFYSTK